MLLGLSARPTLEHQSRPINWDFGADGNGPPGLGRVAGVAPVADMLADRYELGVRLGSGGMGDVYRAHDRRLDRIVAVKVPATTLTPASAERFKREAQAAARLNHPNVVGVYDWGDGATPFIVMEYVQGRSLRAELRDRGPLPPAMVAEVGAQIADALAHAHDHGVVHRDVKPSNVLLTTDGTAKVTDFGIAQSNSGEALTESGVVMGTVGYLSPEQLAGLPLDARSDVYSLGVVLAELLTGERPTGDEPPPSTELERVIARARHVDPNSRVQTAADLRDALRQAEVSVAVPVTAPAVAVDSDRSSEAATARATGASPTALMPTAVAPPPRTPSANPTPTLTPARRRLRRAKTAYPKVARVPKPVKPLEAPKPRRMKGAAVAGAAPTGAATGRRTWKARHWAVIVAAPMFAIAGGIIVYAKVTEHAPNVAVPDVVDHDVFAAIGALKHAGFHVQAVAADSPRPGGTILAQVPGNGHELEQGSTVIITVARTRATVPDVLTLKVEDARAELTKRGLTNITVTPDYRADVDPGTVMSTTPAAFLKATKSDPIVLVVAADPHVTMPNVVGLDQAAATGQLHGLGLEVAVQTASSKSAPLGQVLKSNPGDGETLTRGDTVTLTVSSGPKPVAVPAVVGWSRDDAVSELEDRGFAAVVVTRAVTASDQVDAVLVQNPAGGRAPEGSTVTVTVGVKAKKG
jgi:beta-lactam-binding protein with PASTA domain